MARRPALLLGLLLLLAPACGRADGPDGVARRFMDEYYVRVDLGAAKRVAGGLASQKLDNEVTLTRGQSTAVAMEGRSVAYSLRTQQQEGDRHSFLYEVRVRLTGGGEFTRRAVLLVGRVEGAWRVTNFSESGL